METLRRSIAIFPLLFALVGCAGATTSNETEDELRTGREPVASANPTGLVASENHTCALQAEGELYCWGTNENGQLGIGSREAAPKPVRVGSEKWSDFATASTHSCAVRRDGSLWCFGGDNRLAPKRVGTESDWKRVSVAQSRSCAIKSDGTLWCWEEGGSAEPARFGTDSDWAMVSVAADHACGVRTNGALDCWGKNDFNQLGVRGAESGSTARLPGTWESVSTGGPSLYGYSCGVRRDRSLWCWGYAAADRLGRGNSDQRLGRVGTAQWKLAATSRPNGSSYTAHSAGIRADGSLYGWGWNAEHQVSETNDGSIPRPKRVGNESGWVSIALGDAHSCAARQDGSVWCWGSNASGQLGVDGPAQATPQRLTFPAP